MRFDFGLFAKIWHLDVLEKYSRKVSLSEISTDDEALIDLEKERDVKGSQVLFFMKKLTKFLYR